MENFRLKVFCTVAQKLNFRQAAESLYLTQPAVTLQIKALEEELGVSLFSRNGNRIALTNAGKRLLTHARRMASLVMAAYAEHGKLKGEERGELRVGASTTIAQYVLPRLLVALCRNAEHTPNWPLAAQLDSASRKRSCLECSPENLLSSAAIMWEKIERNRKPCLADLVPGTLHFVASTIHLFHQVGRVRHIGHFVCEEGTRLKLFAISHHSLPVLAPAGILAEKVLPVTLLNRSLPAGWAPLPSAHK
jgi:DNA-binding transcriptional ArsR family regulator